MPNYAYTWVLFKAPDKTAKEIRTQIEDGEFINLRKIKYVPEGLSNNKEWEWKLRNWGCSKFPWNSVWYSDKDVSFISPWSPPTEAFKFLSKKYKDLTIIVLWIIEFLNTDEPIEGILIKNGEIVSDLPEIEIKSDTSIALASDITGYSIEEIKDILEENQELEISKFFKEIYDPVNKVKNEYT